MRVRKRAQKRPDGTTVIHEGAPGGFRRMRCPKCHNIAVPTPRPNGKIVFKCPTCGGEFLMGDPK